MFFNLRLINYLYMYIYIIRYNCILTCIHELYTIFVVFATLNPLTVPVANRISIERHSIMRSRGLIAIIFFTIYDIMCKLQYTILYTERFTEHVHHPEMLSFIQILIFIYTVFINVHNILLKDRLHDYDFFFQVI